MYCHSLINSKLFQAQTIIAQKKWSFYTYTSVARNIPCNRDVSVMAEKTFPKNVEKHGMGDINGTLSWQTTLMYL